MFKLGKSTISTGPFSSSQSVSHYQRVVVNNLGDLKSPFVIRGMSWLEASCRLCITNVKQQEMIVWACLKMGT